MGSAATAAAASVPGLREGGRGGGRPWGRKAEGGRQRAGGGERGRAAGEGAGAAAAGLPRLPRSVRPALARPLLVLLPAWLALPQLPAPAGRASSRPPGRRYAAPFLLRLRLLPHKYQLLNPNPDLAAAAAATLCSGSASRDFRRGLGPPSLDPTRCSSSLSSLSTNRATPLVTQAPPTLNQAPPDWGRCGRGRGGLHARWLAPGA